MTINLSVQRKIDKYNRLAIPRKACEKLGWSLGTNLFCLQMKNDNKFYMFFDMNDFVKLSDFKIENVVNLQTRKMDVLNRIVIPKAICDELHFKSGNKINIKYIDNYVVAENI